MKNQPQVELHGLSALERDLSQHMGESASRRSSILALMDQMDAMAFMSDLQRQQIVIRTLPACNSEV
jgi:hypothetical protein